MTSTLFKHTEVFKHQDYSEQSFPTTLNGLALRFSSSDLDLARGLIYTRSNSHRENL